MNIRRRRGRATLWRTEWVPKGKEGNSHGFKRERYVASIPFDAREVPETIRGLLSPSELAAVHRRVIDPARAAWAMQEQARMTREADALWRLQEALKLTEQARARATRSPDERAAAQQLMAAVDALPYSAPQPAKPNMAGIGQLVAARDALREAARAVKAGALGDAPSTEVRSTQAYRLWSEISALVSPGEKGNLLDELQSRGWVKRRSTST